MSVVCISGMHRSGTSMVARLLNLVGLYLGEEEDLLPPNFANPEGYWENIRFVSLNDKILAEFGGGWDHPPTPPHGWQSGANTLSYRVAAAQVIKGFEGHEPWGWKDPRICLTADLWQDLLPRVKVVICLRNPLDVAHSLKVRGAASTSFSMDLWLEYNRRLLAAIPPERRIVTHYLAYFDQPRMELVRILDFAGIRASIQQIDSAIETITASPTRNHATTLDLLAEQPAFEVVQLYQQMCADAGPIYQAAVAQDPPVPDLSPANYREFVESCQREKLQQELQVLAARLRETARALAERDARLSEIAASRSWKMALLLEQMRMRLAPPGSRRASMARGLVDLVGRAMSRLTKGPASGDVELIRKSELFSERWYLDQNPDVAATGVDPVRHYLLHGGFESRDPSPGFSSRSYLDDHPDVRAAGVNPLLHYLRTREPEPQKAGAPGGSAGPKAPASVRQRANPPRQQRGPHQRGRSRSGNSLARWLGRGVTRLDTGSRTGALRRIREVLAPAGSRRAGVLRRLRDSILVRVRRAQSSRPQRVSWRTGPEADSPWIDEQCLQLISDFVSR